MMHVCPPQSTLNKIKMFCGDCSTFNSENKNQRGTAVDSCLSDLVCPHSCAGDVYVNAGYWNIRS